MFITDLVYSGFSAGDPASFKPRTIIVWKVQLNSRNTKRLRNYSPINIMYECKQGKH